MLVARVLIRRGSVAKYSEDVGAGGDGERTIASLTPRQGAGVRQDAGEGGRSGRRGWEGQSGDALC